MDIVSVSMKVLPMLFVYAGMALLALIVTASRLALLMAFLVSTAALLSWLCLIWFFRDGLGPDAVTSEGLEAASRIAVDAVFPVLGWLLINGSAYVVYRLRHKARVPDKEQQNLHAA